MRPPPPVFAVNDGSFGRKEIPDVGKRPLQTRSQIRVLLIEDDKEFASGLTRSLQQSDYAVDVVHNGQHVLAACERTDYKLIILDLGLPDVDGIEVLKRLRKTIAAPILILSARYDLADRVLGLDAGGDDYLPKFVELSELEARIRALLRRGAPIGAPVEFADLAYEPISRHVVANGFQLELTASELVVLELLLLHQGKVVSKSKFVKALYQQLNEANPSTVEVFMCRLRRKLGTAKSRIQIRSLRGLGYRLEDGHRNNQES